MNQTNTKKKTHKMRYIVAASAIFTMLFCCMGCSKKTPREALEEAYEKTFTESTPTENLLGLSELNAKLNENKAHSTGFSVTLQELSGEGLDEFAGVLSGLGISVDSASDLLNRKHAATMDITYGGTTYLTLGGQIQGSEIFVTSPQLLNNSLSVDLSTLQEDLNSDSVMGQLLKAYGLSLPEDLSSDLFDSLSATDTLESIAGITSACEDLDEAIVVEKLDKKAVSLPSDVSAKTVYSVTVPKYAYLEVINSVLDYANTASLSDSLDAEDFSQEDFDLLNTKLAMQEVADIIGDIVLTVAVTKDGYISYAASSINYGSDSLSLTATFAGENTPLDDIDIVLSASAAGTSVKFYFEQEFDNKDNEIETTVKVTENGSVLLSFGYAGQYSDIEKGQKYTLDFDYIELAMKDAFSVSLAGDYYVDTTKCDIATPPASDYNLFRMTEEDFSVLAQEVLTNLSEDPLLSNLLSLIGLTK